MVVSHDRYFLERVCDHIFAFEDHGKIKDYPGNYTDYREWKAKPKGVVKPLSKSTVEVQVKAKEVKTEKRKMSFKEKHELEQLTKEIEKLQIEISKINNQLSNTKFVDNAPPAVVAKERERLSNSSSSVAQLQEQLVKLALL